MRIKIVGRKDGAFSPTSWPRRRPSRQSCQRWHALTRQKRIVGSRPRPIEAAPPAHSTEARRRYQQRTLVLTTRRTTPLSRPNATSTVMAAQAAIHAWSVRRAVRGRLGYHIDPDARRCHPSNDASLPASWMAAYAAMTKMEKQCRLIANLLQIIE